jgi:hypothetical protein
MRGEAGDRPASEPDCSRRRPLETRDQLQQRALTRPVRTDDGDDFSSAYLKRHVLDGENPAEVLGDCRYFEQRCRLGGARAVLLALGPKKATP